MSPDDVISIRPEDIRFKLSRDLDLGGVIGGDWDITRRVPIEQTDKHRAIFQRYVEGRAWKDTDLFVERYTPQIAAGEPARGCQTIKELVADYESKVDMTFISMKACGFLTKIRGREVQLPKVHVGRDGEVMLGNQGNHRVAMAKVLKLSRISVRVHTVHADAA